MADPASYRPAPGRSPISRASTGSATSAAGSSTSARRTACVRGCRPTSRTSPTCTPRTQSMVTTAASVEWTVVATEVEALQLEYSWIKEFDPRFNVRYRDDKSYPSLAVTLNEEFPRLQVMRGRQEARACATSGPTPTRGRSARPSTCCCGSSRPAPAPRGCSSGPARSAGRACSATSASARRPASAGSAPRSTARSSRTSATSWPARPPTYLRRLEKEMQVAAAEPGVRAGGPAARRHRGARAGDGEAGGRARRRHRRRRHRARRGPARGRRPGLPRPRRSGPRPARLGRRQGRGRHHRRPGRALPAAGVRRRDRRTPCRARCWSRRCRRTPRRSPTWLSATARQRGRRSACRSAATSGP